MRLSLRPTNGNDEVATSSHGTTPESFGKDRENLHDAPLDDGASDLSEKQAGVKRIEAVSKSWTTSSLVIAYVTCVLIILSVSSRTYTDLRNRLLIIANVTSLEIQVTSLLTPYATSAFQLHSLISTIYVVQGIVSGTPHPTPSYQLLRMSILVLRLTCPSGHQASHRQNRRRLRPPGSLHPGNLLLHHRLHPASCLAQRADICERADLLGCGLQWRSSPAADFRSGYV
jgi:hypothetical protein